MKNTKLRKEKNIIVGVFFILCVANPDWPHSFDIDGYVYELLSVIYIFNSFCFLYHFEVVFGLEYTQRKEENKK